MAARGRCAAADVWNKLLATKISENTRKKETKRLRSRVGQRKGEQGTEWQRRGASRGSLRGSSRMEQTAGNEKIRKNAKQRNKDSPSRVGQPKGEQGREWKCRGVSRGSPRGCGHMEGTAGNKEMKQNTKKRKDSPKLGSHRVAWGGQKGSREENGSAGVQAGGRCGCMEGLLATKKVKKSETKAKMTHQSS
jgi:hypothetical protein